MLNALLFCVNAIGACSNTVLHTVTVTKNMSKSEGYFTCLYHARFETPRGTDAEPSVLGYKDVSLGKLSQTLCI